MILKFCALRARVASTICLLLLSCAAYAAAGARAQTASALFISDTHFDPFHDPAKVKALAAAPASEWETILASPDSPTQQQDLDALRAVCAERGPYDSYPLLKSALAAIRQRAQGVRFVTVSGDLLAHKFFCRFAQTMPGATPAEYEAFVEKTWQYQVDRLQQTLPHTPIYLALGNNDSNCDDNKLDTGTPFLAAVGGIVGRAAGSAWNAAAAKDFAAYGSYSVTMAAPMQRTRLIVLNDNLLNNSYTHCSGQTDKAPGEQQVQWLQQQLDAARKLHQRVWIMGHIPIGVNPYGTLSKGPTAVCHGRKPDMFLFSDALADTMAENAPEIQLALFAHSHMDELRLLGSGEKTLPVKFVPSISPVNGNHPAFTVGVVDTATATLADYTVYTAPDSLGSEWTKEYTWSTTYGQRGFTPATLRTVIDGFTADRAGATPESKAYMENFTAGALGQLAPFWPAYVCTMTNMHAVDYTACVCGEK
ncbi:MAG TPA: metallophosphoesterase [Acidobacteriaceae bacterium]